MAQPSQGIQSGSKFDIASIKPTLDADSRLRIRHQPGGTFTATAATLKSLVRHAYGVEDFQVEGTRGWISTDKFEVVAKMESAPEKVSAERFRLMLQELLAKRFQLRVHKESREMNMYALETAKGGPHLERKGDSPKGVSPRDGIMTMRATTVDGLASFISSQVQRVVVNNTNLKGEYDILLSYSPDSAVDSAQPETGRGPSLRAALREQLGLSLVSRKGPTEFVVIDQAARPSAN